MEFLFRIDAKGKGGLSLPFSSIFALFVYDVVQVFYDEVKDANKPSPSLPFRVQLSSTLYGNDAKLVSSSLLVLDPDVSEGGRATGTRSNGRCRSIRKQK